ncbi:MAG: hypothetical protein AAF378_16810 [Cyanobacteria bacterium P01_A01_bin.84]
MNTCPCCNDILLRHVDGHQVRWFCRTCWQSMPVSDYKHSEILSDMYSKDLSRVIHKLAHIDDLANSKTVEIILAS